MWQSLTLHRKSASHFLTLHFFSLGTGSYPLSPHGWHFNILRPPKNRPIIPYCFIASSIYSEQVGLNLHELGNIGDIQYWYIFTNIITSIFIGKKTALMILFTYLYFMVEKFLYLDFDI